MPWRFELQRLVNDCKRDDLDHDRFITGSMLLADRLQDAFDSDEGLQRHFDALVAAGDRLAAVLLLIPYDWEYSLHRDKNHRSRARVGPAGRDPTQEVESADEACAMLAALAKAVLRDAANGN